MQFHKKVTPRTEVIPNNGVHPWLWTGIENKIKIEKYLDKLLFTDHIHNSKVGLVNTFNKEGKLISDDERNRINELFNDNVIDERLRNIFESLYRAENCLTPQDKDKINNLCKENYISQELKDICMALYGSQNLIPDITASQIQKLYEKEFLNDLGLINEGLNCCRDLIFNLGYEDVVLCNSVTMEEDGLKTIVNDTGDKNIMIIPGCQHAGMLTGRVLKAIRVLDNFKHNLTIYASGGNPLDNPTGPDKVSIAQESKFIHNTFYELIKKMNIGLLDNFRVIEENESYNSITNLKKCLNRLSKQESHNLIIVSSTFHLIRLAQEVEKQLTVIFNQGPENTNFIKNIILIGAEGIDAKFTRVKSGGYVKSMFVDVYAELMNYKEVMKTEMKLKQTLETKGYIHLKVNNLLKLHTVINFLGKVIQEKDIQIQEKPGKLSNSNKAMELHTDHPDADYLIMECIEPSTEGGLTLISDFLEVYDKLSSWQQKALRTVEIKDIFNKNELKYCPMVKERNGKLIFHYVPWLTRGDEHAETKELLAKINFELAAQQHPLTLEKGDVLVIDNKRFLHGRTAISGSQNRFLKRYLVQAK
ncbi:MAG TPA: TauD/TfdA family dioxygenase [Mucilaginibacter sp.]|jgi:hypothetical protein|nr:TauD/TfdA family dioxygenase [Mucilaginibacter sp.]